MPKRRKPKKKPAIMLAIPEHVLTKLIDPAEVMPDIDDELESATAYRADLAAAEIAQALIETGRAVGFLHLLVTALDGRGYRRGYAEGALAAGRVFHAVARDEGRSRA